MINYAYLIAARMAAVDGTLHIYEERLLKTYANRLAVDESTHALASLILQREPSAPCDIELLRDVPPEMREEVVKVLIGIAGSDGYFDPAELDLVQRAVSEWGIPADLVEETTRAVEALNENENQRIAEDDDVRPTTWRKPIVKVLTKILPTKTLTSLIETLPEVLRQGLVKEHRAILLSGPAYQEAVAECAKVAGVDLKVVEGALDSICRTLEDCRDKLHRAALLADEPASTHLKGKHRKDVLQVLQNCRLGMDREIQQQILGLQDALNRKKRTAKKYTIVFVGRSKVGKSTLHAVLTRGGWDAIGVGRQRTTRMNRIYEWKKIRMIDTPGVGVPGAEADESITYSVLDEADLVCFVMDTINQQEAEFALLQHLKSTGKPVVILLNVRKDLSAPARRRDFLNCPDGIFSLDDQNLGGHFARIREYACRYYGNAFFDIIPAQFMAARMAIEDPNHTDSAALYHASRINDFLDILRCAIIDHGTIRRSQTVLGSSAASLAGVQQTIHARIDDLAKEVASIAHAKKKFKLDSLNAERRAQEQFRAEFLAIHAEIQELVGPFADEHASKSTKDVGKAWNVHLQRRGLSDRVKVALEAAISRFDQDVEEVLAEIGKEIQITHDLRSDTLSLKGEDSRGLGKKTWKWTGIGLTVASTIAFFFSNPVGWVLAGVSMACGVFSWLCESREKKVVRISKKIYGKIMKHLNKWKHNVSKQAEAVISDRREAILAGVDEYFGDLHAFLEQAKNAMEYSSVALEQTINMINVAYAERILDWVAPKTDYRQDRARKILQVQREIGKSMAIDVKGQVTLRFSNEELRRILQEEVSVRAIERRSK